MSWPAARLGIRVRPWDRGNRSPFGSDGPRNPGRTRAPPEPAPAPVGGVVFRLVGDQGFRGSVHLVVALDVFGPRLMALMGKHHKDLVPLALEHVVPGLLLRHSGSGLQLHAGVRGRIRAILFFEVLFVVLADVAQRYERHRVGGPKHGQKLVYHLWREGVKIVEDFAARRIDRHDRESLLDPAVEERVADLDLPEDPHHPEIVGHGGGLEVAVNRALLGARGDFAIEQDALVLVELAPKATK